MATQSIMRNIVIEEPQAAETLVNALEKAVETSKNNTSSHIEYAEIKGEDIRTLMKGFIK